MEFQENKIVFIVIASTITAALLLLAVVDLMLLYRHRKLKHKSELDEQKRRIDDLLQKHEVDSVNSMLKGQDAERRRIAQELHDRLGSILSTVKLHFSNVQESIKALQQQQNQSYYEATTLLDEAVDEVRRISHDLYEGSLAKFGFKIALLQLIAAVEKANIVKITFMDNGVDETIYKDNERELYRVTQELLGNTLKYANAKEITIQLNLKNSIFEYMYEDDGKGFDPKLADDSNGIGYRNIAARVAKMGGSWHLDTTPGHGMTLLIEIPTHT